MKTGFNPVLAAQPQTIFDVMSGLARELNAINLGQGFPDRDGSEDVRAFAAQSLMTDSNQYPPAPGLAELRMAVADHYRRFQIKSFIGNDDFRAMEEVVGRRYRRLVAEQKPFPDLVVIDGGRGQISAALKA